MSIVSEYSWESDTWSHHTNNVAPDDSLQEHQRWLDAVNAAVVRARSTLPTHDQRISRALDLVVNGHVTPQPGGTFQVRSQRQGGRKVYLVNGKCECPDSAKVSDGLCKHYLAVLLWRRAKRILQDQAQASMHLDLDPMAAESAPAPEPVEPAQGIPHQHIVHIQGKAFVRYAGLLTMAQERGLASLTAEWTYNDPDLSLAHAVATFQDGRRFEESGDASPANTNRKVAVHFRRVALTRAKARVLRDALGIDLVAVEELADSE